MNPHQPYRLSAVPQTLQARLEIASAIRALAAQDEDALAQRRAEIAAIRRECEALKRSIQEAGREWLALVSAGLRSEFKKYSPNQLRVPAGNSGGGQWTSEDGDYSQNGSVDGSRAVGTARPVRYAALDTETPSDASPGAHGVQYVGDANGPQNDATGGRANDNLTAQQICQKAYSDGMASLRMGSSLSPEAYLDARYQLTSALGLCLHVANGVRPASRDGDYFEFFGAGVVIFRPGGFAAYVRRQPSP